MQVEIKPIQSGDHDVWLPLWKGYQAFYKVDIAPDVSETTWTRLLDSSEPMTALLAWIDGRAVGLVHFIRHRSTWTRGDYAYLQDLFVDPAQRAGGIGRKLIEAVYEAAAKEGCSRVYWLTHETNHDAMRLYDKVADRSGFLQYRKQMP